MKNYKSMRGANIDVAKLMLQQEKNISVGNTRSNARGDQLGRGGRVVKGADEIAREHYNKNNPRAVKQTSIKLDDADVKRQIEEAKNNPDPIMDDWKEPEPEEVQVEEEAQPKEEWVEDEDGNFVKASEVKKTSKKTSKKN
jgi:hypothetical protein